MAFNGPAYGAALSEIIKTQSGYDHVAKTGDNTFDIYFKDGSKVSVTIPGISEADLDAKIKAQTEAVFDSHKSEFVGVADLDGETIYKGEDNKIHAVGGGGDSAQTKKNTKDIQRLYKITQGQLWDFEEQNESGMNVVPSGAIAESVLSVDGKTEQKTLDGNSLVLLTADNQTKCGIALRFENGKVYCDGGTTVNGDRYIDLATIDFTQLPDANYVRVETDDINVFGISNVSTLTFRIDDGESRAGKLDCTFTSSARYLAIPDSVKQLTSARLSLRICSDSGITLGKGTATIMICKNTLADFEPYCGGIPSPNPQFSQEVVGVEELNIEVDGETRKIIPPFPLHKIGDYADKLDVVDGVWRRAIDKRHITKSNVTAMESQSKCYSLGRIAEDAKYDGANRINVLCNSYLGVPSINICRESQYAININGGNVYVRDIDAVDKGYLNFDDDIYVVLAEKYHTTTSISSDDLAWIKQNIYDIDADKVITITDQNGNDVSYLVEYMVDLHKVAESVNE